MRKLIIPLFVLLLIGLMMPISAQETIAVGDTVTGGARAVDQHALVSQRFAGNPERGVHAGIGDCAGALNVVVEGRHGLPMTFQDLQRVVLVEVLALDYYARKDGLCGLDELVDQRQVGIAPQSFFPVAELHGVL